MNCIYLAWILNLLDFGLHEVYFTFTLSFHLYFVICTYMLSSSKCTHRPQRLSLKEVDISYSYTDQFFKRYVSDKGFDGFNHYCQQKLLHNLILDPPLPRYYPPSLLEWLATRKRAQMALSVRFPDG